MSGGYSNGVWESRMLLVELRTCPKLTSHLGLLESKE
jgi:hypothetical protein